MSRPQDADRNQEATVYMGNLDERCTDELMWELMLQAGPVVNVHLPKDRISMQHQGYGFCEFLTEEDADYACKIMNQIKLFGKPIRVNKASSDKKQMDIGANLFVGNLDSNVDERMLYETFCAFGSPVLTAKIARDPNTGESKGYGFVSYDNFETSDMAIESMNGQFLMNRPLNVSYALKKDGKGERHGTPAERLLAAQARKNNALPTRPPLPVRAPMGGPPGVGGFPPYGGMAQGMMGYPGYQGAFAGALASAAPPPPPAGMPVYSAPPGPGQMPMGAPDGAPAPPPPPAGLPTSAPQQLGAIPPPPPPGGPSGPGQQPPFMTGTNTAPLGPRGGGQ